MAILNEKLVLSGINNSTILKKAGSGAKGIRSRKWWLNLRRRVLVVLGVNKEMGIGVRDSALGIVP
jgi:hypothetical protein